MAERKRIGVPISGLDTSTPDHSVVDGKCETLHNLRYTGSAWRNTHPFVASDELPDLEGNIIIYHHPADVDNAYITYEKKEAAGKTIYTFYRSEYGYFFNEWSWRHTEDGLLTIVADDLRNIEEIAQIGHFGKMLVIGDNANKTFHFFFLSTAQSDQIYYSKTNFEDVDIDLSLSIPESTEARQTLASALAELPDGDNSNIAYSMVSGADKSFIFETKPNSNDANGQFSKFFRGEFVMVAALVSEEGEIIKLSPFRLFNSAMEVAKTYPNTNRSKAYKFMLDGRVNTAIGSEGRDIRDNSERFYKWPGHLFFCEADATITISNVNVATRASYIDIYATRLYNLIEYKSYTEWGDNTTDLFQEPMYRAKRIQISTIIDNDNEHTFAVTSSLFEALEHGVLLSPTQSAADLYGNISLEYNNRLHLTDVYTKFNYDTLYKYLETDREGYYNITAKVQYDASIYWSQHQIESKNKYLSLANSDFFSLNGHFTTIYFTKDSLSHKKISLRHSDLYNISYALKYSPITELRKVAESFTEAVYGDGYIMAPEKYVSLSEYDDINELPKIDSLIVENIRTPNAVRVSAANIPYSFPYKNSYRVGSGTSKIISINSVAIEMSDSKFGEFPLYVFTNEGVWAMQSGTEILYSAIIPLNYDVIINPNTLAVNNSILYFTDKGINALSRDGSKLISSPIHTKENRIPKWMHESKMVYLPEWNEVMCVDFTDRKIYVLSLDNGVWSTRDIPQGYVINNGELISTDGKIYNLRDEVEGADSEAVTLLEPQAMAFSIMRSVEDTQYQWSSDWGVLKKSGDEDRSIYLYNYHPETEEVGYTKIYIYRPSQPKFSLTKYNFQADVQARLDSSFSPKALIFIADDVIGEPPFNIDSIPEFTSVSVYTPDGKKFTTLKRGSENHEYNTFYDTFTPLDIENEKEYGISFSDDVYEFVSGDRVRIFPAGIDVNDKDFGNNKYDPDKDDNDGYGNGVWPDNCWYDIYKWFKSYYADDDRLIVEDTLYFDEDDSLLYYAFDKPLSLDSPADPFVVCVYNNGSVDTAYICTQTDEDKDEYPFDDHISISEIGSGDDTGGDNGGGGDSSHKIELSQADFNVSRDSKTYSTIVTSTCSWSASSDNDWITINTTTGNAGETQFSFNIAENESNGSRGGVIHIENSEYDIHAFIYVTQSADSQGGDTGGGDNGGGGDSSHKIELSQADFNVSRDSKTYSTIVTSTCSWSASSDNDWITINTTTGNAGETQFSFNIAENESNGSRGGVIHIENSEYDIHAFIYVTQSADSQGGDTGGGDNGGDNGGSGGGSGGDDNTGDVPTYNPTHIRLKTRPIKLGTMELKRAETIIVRFESSTTQSIKVIVKGSIDTNTWHTLREITTKTNKDIVIRRTPFSVKYLQFSIEGECNTDIRILAFEVEYYERMRHRMR